MAIPTTVNPSPPRSPIIFNSKMNGHHKEDSKILSEADFTPDSILEAIESFARGEIVVVMDDMNRENEGDLIIAAEKCDAQSMAFIIKHSSGFVCVPLSQERLDQLEIPMMLPSNTDPHKTAYTVTVDFKEGTTTGISAHDRALTARQLVNPSSTAADFSRPGHIVPLKAKPNGVLERRGHTEAGIDLCRLASLSEGAVICELVKPDDPFGSMARRDDCFKFAKQHNLKIITIEDLVAFRQSLVSSN